MRCEKCQTWCQYLVKVQNEYSSEPNKEESICLECFDGLDNRDEKE